MHINSYNFLLTGTNFGLLNPYPKAKFYDGYLFTDYSGNSNLNYTRTITGGIFLEEFNDPEIPTNDMLFWLDSSDESTITLDVDNNVFSIKDKSTNKDDFDQDKFFIKTSSSNAVLTSFWPVYSSGGITFEEEINTNYSSVSSFLKNCIKFNQNSFLGCSGFSFNFNTGPLTIFFIWKDNNTSSRTIPFSLKTKTGTLTSEFVAHVNHFEDLSYPAIAWGTRGTGSLDPAEQPIGFRVTPLSSSNLFNYPNITYFYSPLGGEYDVYNIESGNIELKPDDSWFHTYYTSTSTFNTIGYKDEENVNDFYFGEILAYKRSLNDIEKDKIFNYLVKKWYLYDVTRDNTVFTTYTSGGAFTNTYYEDVVLKESFFSIPIQSCTTQLSIILSAFDSTTSDISKIVCSYKDNTYKLETPLNIDPLSAESIKRLRKIDVLINPGGNLHRDTYSIKLSVYKFDTTVNVVTLTGEILKCGIHDLYYDNYLLDSQLSYTSNKVYVVNESRENKQLYLNTLDISTTSQVLSGGDEVVLQNIEFLQEQESTISLAELLGIVEQQAFNYKRPVISPVTNPNINPVSPTSNIK
jgi:hypothetical protein